MRCSAAEQCDVVITLRMIKHGQMVILVQKLPQEKLNDSFCSLSLFACLLVIVVVFNFVNKLLNLLSQFSAIWCYTGNTDMYMNIYM